MVVAPVSMGSMGSTCKWMQMYRALGYDISLLTFTQECSQEILGKFGITFTGPGVSLALQKTTFNRQRYYRKHYWLLHLTNSLEDAKIVELGRSTDLRNAKYNFMSSSTKRIMLHRKLGFIHFYLHLF